MVKRILAGLFIVLSLSLASCTAISPASGLKGYVNTSSGYEFLYPNGWLPVKVPDGVDVAFRDLIEETENVSVVISPVADGKTLTDLGTPGEVGYRLGKNVIAPPGSNREAELVSADRRDVEGKTYYTLEYTVTLPQQKRHSLASAVISRGKVYTLNVSTTEARWDKMASTFRKIVNSFTAY
jgi:photosystem II oxygen-evolving enhancer protein 2